MEKAQRRAERKLQQKDPEDAAIPSAPKDPVVTYDEEGKPEGLSFHDF
jgi:hypothetical protein